MTTSIDPAGPLHTASMSGRYWSTTSVGEAMPGVASPLGWSMWGPAVDLGVKDCFARMGALPRDEVKLATGPNHSVTAVFYGRAALNVNFFCEMGGLLPGSGPDAIARQLLGEVPAGIPLATSKRRLPQVAVKMPHALVTIRKDVLTRSAPVHRWWQSWTPRFATLDENGARRALAEGRDHFHEAIRVQAQRSHELPAPAPMPIAGWYSDGQTLTPLVGGYYHKEATAAPKAYHLVFDNGVELHGDLVRPTGRVAVAMQESEVGPEAPNIAATTQDYYAVFRDVAEREFGLFSQNGYIRKVDVFRGGQFIRPGHPPVRG